MRLAITVIFAVGLGAAAGVCAAPEQAPLGSWKGVVRDASGRPVDGARVELRGVVSAKVLVSSTDAEGRFAFTEIKPVRYFLAVHWQGRAAVSPVALEFRAGANLEAGLRISADFQLLFDAAAAGSAPAASGGEQLSSREVSSIPLNKRDLSQLLLLAAGTVSDTSGSSNFTQQYAVNGQRATAAVFAMDGVSTSDPEMGGATFSNFNVDAVQEIDSSSGVMPAEIGRGAAGFTNIISKSGGERVHGSVFEFVRNAAFDARNFFDHRSSVNPRRIPPFARNEFGFTNGGPVALPGIYNGRHRTYYFAQYQGFREVLGTTQVLAVPTLEERRGEDTTTFPGDTLFVPVDPHITPALAIYPLPNAPQGPFGARTYATSSKVSTVANQFSARIDHRLSDKARLFARFSLNNVDGPLTNPSQTAIDPSFATRFFDRQRNVGLSYTRSPSAHFTSETVLGFLRTTPSYPAINRTQPALKFADGLYEPINTAAGAFTVLFANLYQARQNFQWIRGSHTFKTGAEMRANRDSYFGTFSRNGIYAFAGGVAYSPVAIRSASGLHDIAPGEPLPDALTSLLTAMPYSYSVTQVPAGLPAGNRSGEVAIRRESYNFYFQDTWKASPRLVLSYGLRYEVNSRMRAGDGRTSGLVYTDSAGRRTSYAAPGAQARLLLNLKPEYDMDWRGWGPRLGMDWRLASHTIFRAGGAIVTILPTMSQVDFIMGATPFVVEPILFAAPGAPVPFANTASQLDLPPIYTPHGRLIFGPGQSSTNVPANTEMDVDRFERDLAAATPDHRMRPITTYGDAQNFRNGYIGTWAAGLEREFHDVGFYASYTGTAGVKLPRVDFPNGASSAGPAFAPYTRFDAAGNMVGGFGPMLLVTNGSHSSYHSLQASVAKKVPQRGPTFQASYTFSKSLDDTSAVSFTPPQDPRKPGAEKGPSSFDVTHAFSLSLAQLLPAERVPSLRPLGRRFTLGWQLIGVMGMNSGLPFTISSGVQQTDAGGGGARDRPDQVGRPNLSTSRNTREDYFGRGAANATFFSIPIGLPDGTGPNKGRFGTLGRNTFRGPAYHNLDIAVIKDTLLATRGNQEAVTLQFRAEFFNVFNVVNFGLPSHIVLSPGFGVISETAGTSRQIQFSLKLLY
jgi:hypothetical protein